MKRLWRTARRKGRTTLAVVVLFLLAVIAALGRTAPSGQPAGPFSASRLTLGAGDRILVLAPHPDDESIGCGGMIQQAVDLGLPVRVVYLTNGDANEWSFTLYSRRPELLPGQVEAMGQVRQNEALAATKILGLQPAQVTFLGYPDFGTLRIWEGHWGTEPPFRSLLTRVTQVPYAGAYRPGAAYKGEDILADLEANIRAFGPTKMCLSHPADNNPDHEALYAFTRVALWDLGLDPQLYPYLVHTAGWPLPRGAEPELPLTPPASLAGQETWWTLPLSRAQNDRKLAALQAHRTQYESNGRYLSSFIRANELFGAYEDAALPPADGQRGLDAAEPESGAREGLTDEEQAKFVGVEWRTVRREGNDLVLTMALSKPLAEGVGLSAYLFGYRQDKPFAAMPKIHVQIGALTHRVYDQNHPLGEQAVTVNRTAREIVLRVPLALLGGPDRALISARTYLGNVPLDAAAWRVLDFRPSDRNGSG